MKKLGKLTSVLASLVLLGGGVLLTSCSDDDGDSPASTPKVTSVTLGKTSGVIALDDDDTTVTLTATVEAEDGADKTVTWTTGDSEKAKFVLNSEQVETVTGESATVQALAATETNTPVEIIATAGDQRATYKLTIVANSSDKDAAVKAAVLSAIAGTYTVTVGNADPLTVVFKADGKVYAEDGTTEIGTLTFDEDGNVVVAITGDEETYTIAVTDGTADITSVTGSNGSTVTVAKKASENQGDGDDGDGDEEKPQQQQPAGQTYSNTWDFSDTANYPSWTTPIQNADPNNFKKIFTTDGTNINSDFAGADVYIGKGAYIPFKAGAYPVLRTGTVCLNPFAKGSMVYVKGVKGKTKITVEASNTGSNTTPARKIVILASKSLDDLFAETEDVYTKAIKTSDTIGSTTHVTVTTDYTPTDDDAYYIGVACSGGQLRVYSLKIEDSTADFAANDDDALALASMKSYYDAVKAFYTSDSFAAYKENRYFTAAQTAALTALATEPTALADYASVTKAAQDAVFNSLAYVKPTAINIKYGNADVSGTVSDSALTIGGTMKFTATEAAADDAEATGSLAWSVAEATGSFENATFADGVFTGITEAEGSVKVTVKDTDSRAEGLYTTGVTFTVTVTANVVKLESGSTVQITTSDTSALAKDDTITLSAEASTGSDKVTEAVTYAWSYKVGSEEAVTLTTGTGGNATANDDGSISFKLPKAGSYVFTVKATSANYADGIEQSTAAITVKTASTLTYFAGGTDGTGTASDTNVITVGDISFAYGTYGNSNTAVATIASGYPKSLTTASTKVWGIQPTENAQIDIPTDTLVAYATLTITVSKACTITAVSGKTANDKLDGQGTGVIYIDDTLVATGTDAKASVFSDITFTNLTVGSHVIKVGLLTSGKKTAPMKFGVTDLKFTVLSE